MRASRDRKSTRLNSSHQIISYAVFCLKKKKKRTHRAISDASLALMPMQHHIHDKLASKRRSVPLCIIQILDGVPCLFFFNDTATTEIYTLSLHDALPI